MEDFKPDQRIWLRTAMVVLLGLALGLLVARHLFSVIANVQATELAAANFDRLLQPVGAEQTRQALFKLAPGQAVATAWLWGALGVAALLTLIFPLLFNPRLFARPSRWWHGALRYTFHLLAFAGIGWLQALLAGDLLSSSVVMGLVMAVLFVIIGQRGVALSPQRIRSWRSLGRRELASTALYGFISGVAISWVLDTIFHGDLRIETVLQARLYEAVQWAVHFESPRVIPAMHGFLRSTELALALGSASILGGVVALAPATARTPRQWCSYLRGSSCAGPPRARRVMTSLSG